MLLYLGAVAYSCDQKQYHYTAIHVNSVLFYVDFSHLKGIFSDGLHHLSERHFGGKGVSVVNHRLLISVPAVQLHTATAVAKRSAKNTHT